MTDLLHLKLQLIKYEYCNKNTSKFQLFAMQSEQVWDRGEWTKW